jgi:hypothetical protein
MLPKLSTVCAAVWAANTKPHLGADMSTDLCPDPAAVESAQFKSNWAALVTAVVSVKYAAVFTTVHAADIGAFYATKPKADRSANNATIRTAVKSADSCPNRAAQRQSDQAAELQTNESAVSPPDLTAIDSSDGAIKCAAYSTAY